MKKVKSNSLPEIDIQRANGFTTMLNHHLRNKNLSLKAVGLLSKMLSLPPDWDYSLQGLATLNTDGIDGIRSAMKELEEQGYVYRYQTRDENGHMSKARYTVFNIPNVLSPSLENPPSGKPPSENPTTAKPTPAEPPSANPTQINTNQVITQETKDLVSNNQSINLDRMDGMEQRKRYREIIRDNLELEVLAQDKHFDIDRANEMVEIMLDAICSTRSTIRINGEDMPQEVVKSRLLKLDSRHIEYVFQAMDECPSDIRNIRAYILTTLYNATLTMDNYYSALVNRDLYGNSRKEVLP
ncbi:MAG: helix-turn-helix domain-containing protein [Oscillospiraceae bacterium]|nr:helix-turn-helix domain-containing protein [Oscillospiraceae bacterium]